MGQKWDGGSQSRSRGGCLFIQRFVRAEAKSLSRDDVSLLSDTRSNAGEGDGRLSSFRCSSERRRSLFLGTDVSSFRGSSERRRGLFLGVDVSSFRGSSERRRSLFLGVDVSSFRGPPETDVSKTLRLRSVRPKESQNSATPNDL